ncbi:MAG TPA: DinB family protein [Caldithrix sp.]|nr:DinB family protein [Caldithrix sp.]
MDRDKSLREHVLYLLAGGGAHINFEAVMKDFPVELRGKKENGFPYTAWQLLEHLRIARWDILDFCRNPEYVYLNWPADYWSPEESPPDEKAWDKSVESFRKDLKEIQDLVGDPATDLFARIPYGKGQTILREALLVAGTVIPG